MDDITDHHVEGDPIESGHRDRPDSAHATSLSISCDDCSMRCSAACDDCVVTFLVGQDTEESLILDLDQARVVRLLGKAGLVPDLKFRVAG
jgi:hypothetical protein